MGDSFSADPVVLGIVALYLALMLYIGYRASKKIRTNEDFTLAGRRLGPVLLAGTLAATEAGGGSSMGVAEKAYGDWGLSAGWYVLAMTITFALLAILAPKLRQAAVATVPEFFRRRYGESSGIITVVVMILPLIGLTVIQIIASSVIVSVMTGLPYSLCVMLVVVVVTAYSVMGGLWSVTLTDIVAGLLVAVPFALQHGGGWKKIMNFVPQEKLSLTEGIGVGTIISLIVIYVTSFAVGQEAVQRYYAAKDGRSAALGSLYAGAIYLLFAFIPALLGVIAYSMAQSGLIDEALIAQQGDKYVLPLLALEVMPSWLVGLVFAALISATMSSADSDLLAAGSIFANDIYSKWIRPEAPVSELLRVTRYTMILVAILAMVIALTHSDSLITILMFSFSLRAGGAFFPYVIGHYWKKASLAGALASLAAGSLTVILAERFKESSYGLEPVIPGLIISLVAFVSFSSLMPGKESAARET